jgi:hypothetical protein
MDEFDGYAGQARLRIADSEFDVHATLRGYFEPIDGRYHWRGRLTSNDALSAKLNGRTAQATLITARGSAQCTVSEPDPWGRYRVSGISTPPFPVAVAERPAGAGTA